jgi:four helix bundle protein
VACRLLHIAAMNREQLEARSQAFAVRVLSLCAETRKTPAWENSADQLSSAATSAAANYRASGRARSRKEFVAKLGIVNEESDEAVFWLEVMRDAQIGNCTEVGRLLPEAKELRAIFAASYATARRNRGKT